MLWIKAFHVVFMVTWFAGLFYLPRLFVYHADTTDLTSLERFVVMERRLLAMMTIGGVATAVFGFWLLGRYVAASDAYLGQTWLQIKLVLVALLATYHVACWRLCRTFKEGRNTRSGRWYRGFNEIPSVFLILIIVCVIVRPF